MRMLPGIKTITQSVIVSCRNEQFQAKMVGVDSLLPVWKRNSNRNISLQQKNFQKDMMLNPEVKKRLKIYKKFFKQKNLQNGNNFTNNLNSRNLTSFSSFKNAERIYKTKQSEKKKQLKLSVLRRQERENAIKKFHEERLRRKKIYNCKTKKGQPVMKGRIQLLLEKIEKQISL